MVYKKPKSILGFVIPNVFQKLEFQHSRDPKFEPGEADIVAEASENQFLKYVRYINIVIQEPEFEHSQS